MKLNKISMVIAAMAFVGCSSDDFNLSSNKTVDESGMIQLDENFVIAGVGEEGAATRTHWEWDDPIARTALINKFLPIYDNAAGVTLDAAADESLQAVGLCWLGNGAVGTDVYTNYEFYHFGWLNKGADKAIVECNKLTNGSFYNEIGNLTDLTLGVANNLVAGFAAGDEADPTVDFVGAIPAKSLDGTGADNLNYNSGVYKTDNKSIFGGDYIVYYPYNEDFKDAGTIPAKAETAFNNVSTAFDAPEVGKATFRYSAPVEIKGGNQAADFGLFNLSSLVQLRVASPAAAVAGPAIGKKIDKIVLYSAKEQLLKQANLAANQIAAGKKGADLYASTEGTKTIAATFTAPVAPATYPDVLPTNNATLGGAAVTSAYITVLPTTVEDLVALVHATDGTWARVNIGNTVFKAGEAKRLDISVTAASFANDYIAVDEATLLTARNEARAFVNAAVPARSRTATVELIGDITLKAANSPYDFSSNVDDDLITYTGGDIIVPEDVILQVKANIESDLRVLGKSCCTGTNGGQLDIFGGTLNNVTMVPTEANVTAATYDQYNPEVNYFGNTTVAAGKTFDVQAGNVNVWAAINHKGDINIAADAKVTVQAWGNLNFMGSTVVNNGTIEVEKDGKFDMTDANGNATASDGQRMTNNGKFIHNVDAGVGTAVQSMHQNGEYRCKVDDQIKLDDAFLQWTACSVIEMVNAGPISYDLVNASQISTPFKHKGDYINIEVNTPGVITEFNNNSHDDLNIQIKNLTVTAGQLDIDFVDPVGAGTNWHGYRTLTVNGDMTVKALTNILTSEKITVTNNVNVQGAQLYYQGGNFALAGPTVLNNKAFAVAKNITVSGGAGFFNAGDVDALNITCTNFTLSGGARAEFGNRTGGASKNMVVNGTINNGAGCTFWIYAANTPAPGSVLAWVSCKQLIATGNFPGSKPRVE